MPKYLKSVIEISKNNYQVHLRHEHMVKLQCHDYGFDCGFSVEGTDVSKIIEYFGKHTEVEHGIEYSKESLMQFIIRKGYENHLI